MDQQHEAHGGFKPIVLDIDSNVSDGDSAIGMSNISSMQFLRSSLFELIEGNGCTYQFYKQGLYYFPNDEIFNTNCLFLLTLDGRLFLAPLTERRTVLDIGTGTGIWAMEFATQNPLPKVIGTELSAIQPDCVPINCNCSFLIDDAEDELSFVKNLITTMAARLDVMLYRSLHRIQESLRFARPVRIF